MIPDNVEKIIMTKEDYDRNVEQLLVDKCEAELEVERLNNIIDELGKDINNQLTMTRKFDEYNEGFFNATLHYYNKLNELKGDNK